MGGAFVTIPALTSRWIKLSQHEAQATSLVLATGIGGAASFAVAGAVDWPTAAAVAASGMATAQAGTRLSAKLPGHVMKGALGAFMICTSGAVLLKPYLLGDREASSMKSTMKGDDTSSAFLER